MLDAAFTGTRVLELSAGLTAGVCGRFFADLGADVLRVEQLEPPPERPEDLALLDWARGNKRTLQPDAAGITAADVERLAADADLIIADLPARRWAEQFSSPEQLVAAHPHLIFLAITPFGRSGPGAELLSTDLV